MQWLFDLLDKLFCFVPRLVMVEPNELGIRITLGNRVFDLVPGWYWFCPIIQQILKVDAQEQVIDLPEQILTTKDGRTVYISGGISYTIKHARKAILSVQDFDKAMQAAAMGHITNFVLENNFDECRKIDIICDGIYDAVRKHGFRWGIEVKSAFLTDVSEGKVVRIALKNSGGSVPIPFEE